MATDGKVAASTQNQALQALVFLYREVLGIELPQLDSVVRARRPRRVPVVLSRDEVLRVYAQVGGRRSWWWPALRLWAAALPEALDLRVKDLDFERRQVPCGAARVTRTG